MIDRFKCNMSGASVRLDGKIDCTAISSCSESSSAGAATFLSTNKTEVNLRKPRNLVVLSFFYRLVRRGRSKVVAV